MWLFSKNIHGVSATIPACHRFATGMKPSNKGLPFNSTSSNRQREKPTSKLDRLRANLYVSYLYVNSEMTTKTVPAQTIVICPWCGCRKSSALSTCEICASAPTEALRRDRIIERDTLPASMQSSVAKLPLQAATQLKRRRPERAWAGLPWLILSTGLALAAALMKLFT